MNYGVCSGIRKGRAAWLVIAMLTLVAVGTLAAPPTLRADEVRKVVWHVDFADPQRFSAMLTSLYNMATTYDSNLVDYDIRVVFVGPGIRFLTDDKLKGTPFAERRKFRKRRQELKRRLRSLQISAGVKIELCNITRESIGLDKSKFYKGVKFVTSGVVRIAELQSKGYAYIKVQ